MPDAATLKEWAESWVDESWDRVIDREKAGASPEVVWFRRGEHAAYKHLLDLLHRHPELDGPIDAHLP